jgi:hypothetical protein
MPRGGFLAAHSGRSEKSATPELVRRVGLRRIFRPLLTRFLTPGCSDIWISGDVRCFAKRTHSACETNPFFRVEWRVRAISNVPSSNLRWMLRVFAKRTQFRGHADVEESLPSRVQCAGKRGIRWDSAREVGFPWPSWRYRPTTCPVDVSTPAL